MTYSRERRRFTIILRGRSIDLAFWMMMTLAIIILFIIPLEFNYYEAVQPVPAPNYYDIWVSSVMMEYVDWRDRGVPSLTFSEPVTIAAAIAICIPAILLNRRIRNHEPTKSIRDAGLAAFFGTVVLTIFLVERFPPVELAWLVQMSPAWKLHRFSTLVMVVLIILPLMIREISHRDFQRKHKILACAIGLISTLVPAGIVASFPSGFVYYQAISPSYQFWYEATIPSVPWLAVDRVYIVFTVFDPMRLLYGFAYTGLHILYGFSILRYLRGLASKRRVFLLGVSSILIPYAAVYPMVVLDALIPTIFIPLPILFILGISVLAVSKPIGIIPHTEFDDSEDEPTSGFAETEEKISVPVLYLIRSKLLGVKRRITKQSYKLSDVPNPNYDKWDESVWELKEVLEADKETLEKRIPILLEEENELIEMVQNNPARAEEYNEKLRLIRRYRLDHELSLEEIKAKLDRKTGM